MVSLQNVESSVHVVLHLCALSRSLWNLVSKWAHELNCFSCIYADNFEQKHGTGLDVHNEAAILFCPQLGVFPSC